MQVQKLPFQNIDSLCAYDESVCINKNQNLHIINPNGTIERTYQAAQGPFKLLIAFHEKLIGCTDTQVHLLDLSWELPDGDSSTPVTSSFEGSVVDYTYAKDELVLLTTEKILSLDKEDNVSELDSNTGTSILFHESSLYLGKESGMLYRWNVYDQKWDQLTQCFGTVTALYGLNNYIVVNQSRGDLLIINTKSPSSTLHKKRACIGTQGSSLLLKHSDQIIESDPEKKSEKTLGTLPASGSYLFFGSTLYTTA